MQNSKYDIFETIFVSKKNNLLSIFNTEATNNQVLHTKVDAQQTFLIFLQKSAAIFYNERLTEKKYFLDFWGGWLGGDPPTPNYFLSSFSFFSGNLPFQVQFSARWWFAVSPSPNLMISPLITKPYNELPAQE